MQTLQIARAQMNAELEIGKSPTNFTGQQNCQISV